MGDAAGNAELRPVRGAKRKEGWAGPRSPPRLQSEPPGPGRPSETRPVRGRLVFCFAVAEVGSGSGGVRSREAASPAARARARGAALWIRGPEFGSGGMAGSGPCGGRAGGPRRLRASGGPSARRVRTSRVRRGALGILRGPGRCSGVTAGLGRAAQSTPSPIGAARA